MTEQTERRERGLARLAELGDEPGGEEFLARMGDMGEWLVDFVFGEVHAALAYAAGGDGAGLAKLVDGLRALDARGHPMAGTVALPMVLGVAAFAVGDHAGALRNLEPVEREFHRVGGSHAQWELYEETMVACQLRLGRLDDAARLLRRRLALRPSPRDLAWMSRVGQSS